MQNFDEKWFVKDSSGVVSGPVPLSALRARAKSGSLAADSMASRDGKNWTSVVLVPELKLDCLVLSVDDGFNVLGPFPRDYLDDPDVMAGIPGNGVFFVRDESLAALRRLHEAEARAAAAEKAEREARAACAEAEKKLAAAEAGREETAARLAETEAERKKTSEKLSETADRLAEAEGARLETARKLAETEEARSAAAEKAAKADAEAAAAAEKISNARKESELSAAAAAEAVKRAETAESDLARMKNALKTLAGIGAAPAPAEIVEPEIVTNAPDRTRQGRSGGTMSGAAALEAQLQKEISMMAGKAGGFPGMRK